MEISLHQFVLDKLEDSKGTWPTVAEESGVPLRTLEKIARQEIENPGIQHVERLARYFRSIKQVNGGGSERRAAPG